MMEHRDLLGGFIRLHILHHAAQHEIFGMWMIEELARHGYKLSPGTIYPILHGMEKRGYLSVRVERDGRTERKLYAITPYGRQGLELARLRVQELVGKRHKAAEA